MYIKLIAKIQQCVLRQSIHMSRPEVAVYRALPLLTHKIHSHLNIYHLRICTVTFCLVHIHALCELNKYIFGAKHNNNDNILHDSMSLFCWFYWTDYLLNDWVHKKNIQQRQFSLENQIEIPGSDVDVNGRGVYAISMAFNVGRIQWTFWNKRKTNTKAIGRRCWLV